MPADKCQLQTRSVATKKKKKYSNLGRMKRNACLQSARLTTTTTKTLISDFNENKRTATALIAPNHRIELAKSMDGAVECSSSMRAACVRAILSLEQKRTRTVFPHVFCCANINLCSSPLGFSFRYCLGPRRKTTDLVCECAIVCGAHRIRLHLYDAQCTR